MVIPTPFTRAYTNHFWKRDGGVRNRVLQVYSSPGSRWFLGRGWMLSACLAEASTNFDFDFDERQDRRELTAPAANLTLS
jgi:hypothetical protein